MKKNFTYWRLALLAAIVMTVSACKQQKLADVLSKETYPSVNISLPAKMDVGQGSTFTVNPGDITIPITATFSGTTSRAFSLYLTANVDTVVNLVAAGKLPAGTTAFTSSTASVPQVVTVPAGVTSYTFNLSVSRSHVELNYKQNIAVVVKATSSEKGNTLIAGQTATVVTVKTSEVLDPSAVHVLTIGTPSTTVVFPGGAANGNTTADITKPTYVVGSESITFNIPIKLSGELGTSLTVDAMAVPDSVTKYINNGILANSVLYPIDKISVPNPRIFFADNAPVAVFSFSTKINTLLALQPAAGLPSVKMPTVAFKFYNPSKFKFAPANTVYVALDCNAFRPYYGTPFVIKGAINAVSDPIYCAYYDLGGEGVAWHDNTSKEGDGAWRAPDYVDVVADYTPRSTVGWNADGEWLTFSVFVEQAGTYQMDFVAGSSNSNGRYSIFLDNVALVSNKTVAQTSTINYSNQQANTNTVTLTASQTGYHILKMFWDKGSMDVRGVIFTRKS